MHVLYCWLCKWCVIILLVFIILYIIKSFLCRPTENMDQVASRAEAAVVDWHISSLAENTSVQVCIWTPGNRLMIALWCGRGLPVAGCVNSFVSVTDNDDDDDDCAQVNVLEPHPHLPLLATSGLDSDVKLWMPTASQPPNTSALQRASASTVVRVNHACMCLVLALGLYEQQFPDNQTWL